MKMNRLVLTSITFLLSAAAAQAAGLYFAGNHSSGDLTITARESSGNEFWKMVVIGYAGRRRKTNRWKCVT